MTHGWGVTIVVAGEVGKSIQGKVGLQDMTDKLFCRCGAVREWDGKFFVLQVE
jgi:hypothetical protein